MTEQLVETERLITWNVGSKGDTLVERALMDLVAKYSPAAIALQEVADRTKVVNGVAARAGYQLTRFTTGDHSASLAILTRPDVEHDGADGIFMMTKRSKVGRKVAGSKDDGWTRPKHTIYTRVRLMDTSWVVASTHLTPTHKVKAVQVLVGIQVTMLAAWMRTRPRMVALGGDFNETLNAKWNLLAPLRLLATPFTAPSHAGNRAIDYWWLPTKKLEKRGIRVAAVEALAGYPSDHKPVMITVTRENLSHACPTCELVHEPPR